MVFQSYALWPHLTVWQNVAFGLELRRRPREEIRRRVGEALERVRMADRARQRPNQLSGGQQQRVALARALVIEPTCLLLDEPLSNLDAKLRLEMRAEIRRICKQAGLTALYVTHDQKEALSIADRVAVLRAGRVEQCGAPQEVYRRPANRFVAGFIGETNVLDGTLAAVDAGRARVRTAWGELISAAPLPPGLAAGGAIAVSIRPEAIRIGTEPAGMPNAFDASLHHTVYLGEMAQHEVQRADGAGAPALKAFELRPRVVARDDRSHRTRIWVDPDDVVLVSA
jgi:iron(III) transport system ATP-binding protein